MRDAFDGPKSLQQFSTGQRRVGTGVVADAERRGRHSHAGAWERGFSGAYRVPSQGEKGAAYFVGAGVVSAWGLVACGAGAGLSASSAWGRMSSK